MITAAERKRVATEIARNFHATYERLAPDHGYRTREESARPWHAVPSANRHLMIDTVLDLLAQGIVLPGPSTILGDGHTNTHTSG